MHGSFSRTVFSLSIAETDCSRDYWATREWVSPAAQADIRSSAIIAVPWENFRDGEKALFPQGTADVIALVRKAFNDKEIAVGIDREFYKEIALHGREWRLPTFLVTAVLVPALVQVLGNRIDNALFSPTEKDSVEVELIVEGSRGRCMSLKYKGPPSRLIETLTNETKNCFPDELKGQPYENEKRRIGRKPHKTRKVTS